LRSSLERLKELVFLRNVRNRLSSDEEDGALSLTAVKASRLAALEMVTDKEEHLLFSTTLIVQEDHGLGGRNLTFYSHSSACEVQNVGNITHCDEPRGEIY